MKQHSFISRLKSLAVVFGIALAFASCANEDVPQNPTKSNEDIRGIKRNVTKWKMIENDYIH